MRQVFQTVLGDKGNCLQASIASVLDRRLDGVPDFRENGLNSDQQWPVAFQRKLNSIGYIYTAVCFSGSLHDARAVSDLCEETGGYFVTVGHNANGAMHSNVWNKDGFVFDPYLLGDQDFIQNYVIAYVITKLPTINDATVIAYQERIDLNLK